MDLAPEDAVALVPLAQEVARALVGSGIGTDGVNLLVSDGEVAGQEVEHVHLHVVPRTPGDGVEVRARFGSPSRDELDGVAAAVRAAL